MLQVHQDLGLVLTDDTESWRRTKRGPDDHQQIPLKGAISAFAGSVANTKRNRSAFSNVTNSSTASSAATRSYSRSSYTSVRSDVRGNLTGNEIRIDLVEVPKWNGLESKERMALSPSTSAGLAELENALDDDMETEERTAPEYLFEEDIIRRNDPQYCTEYVYEIFDNLLRAESKHVPSPSYMDTVQTDINQNMRGILIDWLVEVAEEYKLSSENLYLSTNYVDRYLSVEPIMRGKLQLVGVSCMLIASKYEEIFAPQVEDFVYITDNTYTADQVLQMETIVLKTLRFSLTAVTPYCFLVRLASITRMSDQLKHLSQYLAEITLQEYSFMKYRASQIAFSATLLARHTLSKPAMSDCLHRLCGMWRIQLEDLQSCIHAMHSTHTRIFDKTRPLQASADKYSHSRLSRVSLLAPAVSCPNLLGGK